jgi:hypothetical protein
MNPTNNKYITEISQIEVPVLQFANQIFLPH